MKRNLILLAGLLLASILAHAQALILKPINGLLYYKQGNAAYKLGSIPTLDSLKINSRLAAKTSFQNLKDSLVAHRTRSNALYRPKTDIGGDVSIPASGTNATLISVNPNPGTFGNGTSIPVLTIDSKGRITGASTVPAPSGTGDLTAINNALSQKATGQALIDSLNNARNRSNQLYRPKADITGDVSISASGSTATLATVNGSPGTYGNVITVPIISVDAKGRVTQINQTPISLFGLGAVSQSTFDNALALKVSLQALRDSLNSVRAKSDLIYRPRSDIGGDISLPASGTSATLATVNTNPGTFGNGTTIPVLTIDAKGRVVSVGTAPIAVSSDGGVSSAALDLKASKQSLIDSLAAARTKSNQLYRPATPITGDVSISASGSTATLTTVFTSPGSYGTSTIVPVPTIDGKGRVTGIVLTPISLPGLGGLDSLKINTRLALKTTYKNLSDSLAWHRLKSNQLYRPATAITGDVNVAANGSTATLATVNPSPGTFGNGTSLPILTVDGKGRVVSVGSTPLSLSGLGGMDSTATKNALALKASLQSVKDSLTANRTRSNLLYRPKADITGDVSIGANGSTATLATVNGSPGSYGNATTVAVPTVDSKGRVTSVALVPISLSGLGGLDSLKVNNKLALKATNQNLKDSTSALKQSIKAVSSSIAYNNKVTTAQRDAIASPDEGRQVYNITTHQYEYYNGTAWAALGTTVTTVVTTPVVAYSSIADLNQAIALQSVTSAPKTFYMAPGNYNITSQSIVINNKRGVTIAPQIAGTVNIYNGTTDYSTIYITGFSPRCRITGLNMYGTVNSSNTIYKGLIQTDYTSQPDSLEIDHNFFSNPGAFQNICAFVPVEQFIKQAKPFRDVYVHHNTVKGGGASFVEINAHNHEYGDTTTYVINYRHEFNTTDSTGLRNRNFGVSASVSGRNLNTQIRYNTTKDAQYAAWEIVGGTNPILEYNTTQASDNQTGGFSAYALSGATLIGPNTIVRNKNVKISYGGGKLKTGRPYALASIDGFTVTGGEWTSDAWSEIAECTNGSFLNTTLTMMKGAEGGGGNVIQILRSNKINIFGGKTIQPNQSQTNYSGVQLGVGGDISTDCKVVDLEVIRLGNTADSPVHSESNTNTIQLKNP